MGIEKIKCTKFELEEKINWCCEKLKISCEKYSDTDKLMQFRLIREDSEGKLRVYITKRGLKIDDSIFQAKDLYNEFEEEIKEVLEKAEIESYKFEKIDEEQFKIIVDEINEMCNNDILKIDREIKDPNKTHFFEIKDIRTGEKVLISRYTNGTVTLNGVNWLLWTDICSIIDFEINSTPLDIFDRILETKNIPNNEIDIKYTVENYEEEIATIKESLTCEVYNFLDNHFKNYLISSQRIINSEIVLPEYSPILCPLAKVLEGYLKRLLVKLNIEKESNITPTWNFGNIFNGTSINIRNGGIISSNQKDELINIYMEIKAFRNNQNHGGLDSTHDYTDRLKCIERYKEIIEVIKSSYCNIYV